MDNRLTSKSSLRNSFNKNRVGGIGKDRSANLYGNFFEGFIEEYVPRKNGKGKKIVRTYVGKYYSPDETYRKFWVTKLLYAALFVIGFILFISAASQPGTPGMSFLVVIPQAVSVYVMLWVLVAFGAFLPAGKKMTIGEYKRSSPALINSCKWLAVCYLVSALGEAAWVLFVSSEQAGAMLFCALRLLIAAAFPFAISRMEGVQKYDQVDNPNSRLVETARESEQNQTKNDEEWEED